MACLRADLDSLVTQGQGRWTDDLRITTTQAGIKQGRGSKLSIYQDIGLDLIYLSIYLSIDLLLRRLILLVLFRGVFCCVVGLVSNFHCSLTFDFLGLLGEVLEGLGGFEGLMQS